MTMTTDEFKAWAERIGKLRGKDRLSEREIAELLGWARGSVTKRLHGLEPVPTYIDLACRYVEIMERAKAR
jgi:transcriptional regulator with XRE-family HTH domain